MSLDKAQPPAMSDGGNGPPHVRSASPVLLGLLFATLLVVAVVSGRPPLKYSPGESARADVHARVTFEFVDVEKTRQARNQAWLRTPNVYEADNESLAVNEATLVRTLEDLRLAADPKTKLEELGSQLPVPAGEVPVLLADLRQGETRSSVRVGLRELFDRIFAVGVMSDDRKIEEEKAVSQAIIVTRASGGQATRVESKDILSVTTARRFVDEFLGSRLGAGLTGTTEALRTWLKKRMTPTLTYDETATLRDRKMAEENVPPQHVTVQAEEPIVTRGNRVSLRQYDMLVAEQKEFLRKQSPVDWWKRLVGTAVLVGTAFVLGGLYLRHYRPRVLESRTRTTVLGLLIVVMVLTSRLLVHTRWLPHPLYLVPVGFASMILALAYDRRFASGITLFLVILVGLATDADFRPLLVLAAGGVVTSLYTHNIRKRTRLLQVGLLGGLTHVVVIYGVGVGQAEGLAGLQALSGQAAVGMLNGILVGFLITGLLPFLESIFRITTDISLLELGDLNQPVLKSFALRAPGSYNHSLTVGVLAEAAARAIGADDLLARVGSYFHDIGKINKPHYFVENQGDQGSRHDTLSPRMSALVITAHTKDGLELGLALGLPRPILDIIAEHHGTTLVEFFYKRACLKAGENDPPAYAGRSPRSGGRRPDEHLYRYPGPKPRSKESAIVMLADSVESASRVLSNPTPARVAGLVHQITSAKLSDGQLEDCTLTLRELHGIETSLAKGLTSIFHGRIKY